jgi:hypothetical protein
VLGTVLSALAQAQQTAPVQPGSNLTPQDLAKSVHNPFEDFVKVPLQSTTGFSIGPHHNAGENLNVQPLIPFSLNAEWDLMTRPSLSATYQPSPHEQFGLNDLQVLFLLTLTALTFGSGGPAPSFSSQRRPVMHLEPADGLQVLLRR